MARAVTNATRGASRAGRRPRGVSPSRSDPAGRAPSVTPRRSPRLNPLEGAARHSPSLRTSLRSSPRTSPRSSPVRPPPPPLPNSKWPLTLKLLAVTKDSYNTHTTGTPMTGEITASSFTNFKSQIIENLRNRVRRAVLVEGKWALEDEEATTANLGANLNVFLRFGIGKAGHMFDPSPGVNAAFM